MNFGFSANATIYIGIAGSVILTIVNTIAILRGKSPAISLSFFFSFLSVLLVGLFLDGAPFLAAVSAGLSFGLTLFICYLVQTAIVKRTSARYLYLKNLNAGEFPKNLQSSFSYTDSLKSRRQLENLNPDTRMMTVLKNNPNIQKDMEAAEQIEKILKRNQKSFSSAPPLNNSKGFLYASIERSLTEAQERALLPDAPAFSVTFAYTSPKGRNRLSSTYTYTYEEMRGFLRKLKEAEARRTAAQYERSLVNRDLRYDIMKRDGFKCVLCGRTTADGVKLHVDHRVPIAKGGKTYPENLRTLCEDCNLGKSSKYDRYGLN